MWTCEVRQEKSKDRIRGMPCLVLKIGAVPFGTVKCLMRHKIFAENIL